MRLSNVSIQEVTKSVRVLTDFETRQVHVQKASKKNWENVTSFNYMSDDYAFTNARISANQVARRIGEL